MMRAEMVGWHCRFGWLGLNIFRGEKVGGIGHLPERRATDDPQGRLYLAALTARGHLGLQRHRTLILLENSIPTHIPHKAHTAPRYRCPEQ